MTSRSLEKPLHFSAPLAAKLEQEHVGVGISLCALCVLPTSSAAVTYQFHHRAVNCQLLEARQHHSFARTLKVPSLLKLAHDTYK